MRGGWCRSWCMELGSPRRRRKPSSSRCSDRISGWALSAILRFREVTTSPALARPSGSAQPAQEDRMMTRIYGAMTCEHCRTAPTAAREGHAKARGCVGHVDERQAWWPALWPALERNSDIGGLRKASRSILPFPSSPIGDPDEAHYVGTHSLATAAAYWGRPAKTKPAAGAVQRSSRAKSPSDTLRRFFYVTIPCMFV